MDDLISRQAAIDALGERPMVWMDSDYEIAQRNQYDMDKLAIETVPSAQPDSVPVVRCEHCAHKKNCQWYYYSGDDYGFCNWAVREEHEQKKH